MVFLLIFHQKWLPKASREWSIFLTFPLLLPRGGFWKVPGLILAPFCLHFGRFWHPFGSTWVASGTFFVSIFDNFALTLFYFGTRARRAPDSAAAPAEKTKETSSNNLYFAQHLSTRPRAEPCLWQPGLIDQR